MRALSRLEPCLRGRVDRVCVLARRREVQRQW
jgi:hypothetical protein